MDSQLPPGPPYPSLIQGLGFWTRPLPFLESCRARYGKRFTMRLPLMRPFVTVTTPEEVKQIYTAPADVLYPGQGARVLQPLVGIHSILLLDEDAHMEQRKLMLPAFHGERIERLSDLVEEVVDREVATWGTGEIELHPRMQQLTLEIILRAVFGLDPGERLDTIRERIATLLDFGDQPITLLPPPPMWLQRWFDRVGPVRGFLTLREEIKSLVGELIAERRRDSSGRDDVLSLLLDASHEDGTPMSDDELFDELMTLLVAGHETTSTTLAWAFERLVRRPEVLATLAAEVASGNGDAYVTATIQETLRHRPVLPNTMPRAVKKPIEVGGRHYEPGCSLVANAYLLHHDADLYPDPYVFRPERFIDSPPGTYSWIPFGGGRRRCLGASFAMLEMEAVIPAVMRSYALTPTDARPERGRRRNITVRPARGSRVALAPRTPVAVAV